MSEKNEPKLVDGYKHNPLPNRKQRREQARAKNKQAWYEANRQWQSLNNQTRIRGAEVENAGGSDGREKTN